MTIKKHTYPLADELTSFLEENHYQGESESLGLMLMTYDDIPCKQANHIAFLSVAPKQLVQFKERPSKKLH